MASSKCTHSNSSSDISHVLDSLGSLIGELNAINIDKVDHPEQFRDESAFDSDLSLETFVTNSDNLTHSIDKKSDFTSTQKCSNLVPGCSEFKGTNTTSTPSSFQQSHSSASLKIDKNDNYYSVPQGTKSGGSTSPQSSYLQFYNPVSSKKQESGSNFVYRLTRTWHKGSINEVALSQEVHGSFRKTENESSKDVAAGEEHVCVPTSDPKAEPNHYVAPCELDCPKSTLEHFKSHVAESRMAINSQQVKQKKCSLEEHVPVNVFNEDKEPIGLLVSPYMTAREACQKLVLLSKVEDDPQWVIVEHLTNLGLERNLEDHETVLTVLNTWAPGSSNKLLFRKDAKHYHFFVHTSNYFPPHLLDSENSDKAVTEKARRAKIILQQKLFSTCSRVPEIEGTLQCKEFGKKSWNKKFLFLRGSGIYSSNKGKSKASQDLQCYVQFDGANLFNFVNPKKSHKSPTEYCFCIVPFRARELKELKCFSVDDDKTLMSWKMAVRIAKFGPQLRKNYDDMLRKFSKLSKYREQQASETNQENIVSEIGEEKKCLKEGQVAMDFTGDRGRLITDSKVIQELANSRNRVKLSRRMSSNSFIPTDTGVAAENFVSEPWYHGRITREQSLGLLMEAGVQDGLFLVRQSCSVAGVFVLTFCMNQRVYHCQVVQDIGEGTQIFFSLGKGPAFTTLHELIEFYRQKPLNGVSLALRTPCPKP